MLKRRHRIRNWIPENKFNDILHQNEHWLIYFCVKFEGILLDKWV